MDGKLNTAEDALDNTKNQFETAKSEVNRPFVKEDELKEKSARLDELNIMLNMDEKESEIIDDGLDEESVEEDNVRQPPKREYSMSR